jgi:hypothetical protein
MKRALVSLAAAVLFVACGFPEVSYRDGGADGGGDADETADAPIGTEGSSGDGAGGDGAGGDGAGGDGAGGDGAAEDGAREDATSGADSASEAGDATFLVDGQGTGADATNEAGDSSAGVDTGIDAPVTGLDATADAPGDANVADAPPADSGNDASGGVHDAGADAPLVCDVDQDTYTSMLTCGGSDCCDTDSRAHPGQTTFFIQADACGSFDYDCNTTEDPQYPVNLTCGGTGLTACTGGSGFLLDPGCGNSGLFGTCVPNGLLACQPGDEMTLTQGCR